MRSMLHAMFAALAAVALIQFSPAASAQSPVQPVVKQIKLTEKQVQGFIAAQKEMTAILEKIQGATADQLPPKLQADLEAAAKKHGFKDFADYDTVVDNITMVMAGIDPQTKRFTEPAILLQKDIDALTADKTVPADEKKQMLEEMKEALKTLVPIQFPSNIELVVKYYDKIDAALS
jgi:soluble cytochrome b562